MSRYGQADTPWLESRDKDRLGLTKYAQALARFVGDCQTPMTVAIQGEWGSGKTSLMNMTHHELSKRGEDEPKIFFLRFETWQYGAVGDEDMLGFHLLADLTRGIAEKRQEDLSVLKHVSKLGNLVGAFGRAAAAGTASTLSRGIVDGATLVEGVQQAFTGPKPDSASAEVSAIKVTFQKLVEEVTKPSGKRGRSKLPGRFVVFIDDLDRIRPGKAVALLEVLKNFMDVENCVFVVACDYDVVRQGVQDRLGITDEEKISAFFHKIFQVPFRMPVREYRIQGLLQHFLAAKLEQEGLTKRAWSDKSRDYAERLSELVQLATETNPRAFKRFLNVLDLLSCVAGTGDGARSPWAEEHDCLSLVGLVALQTRWPKVASYAASRSDHTELDRLLQTLADGLEEGDDDEDEELTGLLQVSYGQEGSPSAYRQHPDVQDLCSFSRDFFRLLDADKNGELSDEEARAFFHWARQLSLTSVETTSGGYGQRWYKFRAEVRARGGDAAGAYLSVLQAMDKRKRRWKRTEIVRLSDTWYSCVQIGGSGRRVISFNAALRVKLNAGPAQDEHWGLPGLGAIGQRFAEASAAQGIAWTLSGSGRHYTLDFAEAHPRGEALDTLRALLAELHTEIDSLAEEVERQRAAEARAALPEPVAEPAPSSPAPMTNRELTTPSEAI